MIVCRADYKAVMQTLSKPLATYTSRWFESNFDSFVRSRGSNTQAPRGVDVLLQKFLRFPLRPTSQTPTEEPGMVVRRATVLLSTAALLVCSLPGLSADCSEDYTGKSLHRCNKLVRGPQLSRSRAPILLLRPVARAAGIESSKEFCRSHWN